MRSIKLALAAAALVAAPSAASAAVIGSLGGGSGPFLSLSSAGLNGGSVATLSGGTIYTSDQPFADIPKGALFGGNFLAAGPRAGQPATLTFSGTLNYLSFLWGSPDTYNALTITTNLGSFAFTAAGVGIPSPTGNQLVSSYVQFNTTGAGEFIRSVVFTNSPANDAFEVANFSTTAIPEPATWAMMIMGFGLIASRLRSRRTRTGTIVSA